MVIQDLLGWWGRNQNSQTWDALAAHAHKRAVEEINEKIRKEKQDEAHKNQAGLLQIGESRALREHAENVE